MMPALVAAKSTAPGNREDIANGSSTDIPKQTPQRSQEKPLPHASFQGKGNRFPVLSGG